jgi:GNAT superfamily N-acetyltransferase
VSATGVVLRDDGFALRALRVGVHPGALVIHVGTDVVVRTPARPDHREGNVVDLLTPPDAAEVPAHLEAARRLMEPVGVRHLHLRYELPAGEADDGERAAALTAAGMLAADLRVLTLAPSALPNAAVQPPADVTFERLATPEGDVMAERRWYAASVLDRYAHGDAVDVWRAWDEEWGGWQRERVTALARAGRAEVWLAARHGMPVATVTLLDDQDGLVVVDGLVTHPAHRRRGIARALVSAAIASLRTVPGVDRIALAAPTGSPAESLARSLGFGPAGDVRSWLRQDPDADPNTSGT